MIRLMEARTLNVTGLPRTRGDDPIMPHVDTPISAFAPHARG